MVRRMPGGGARKFRAAPRKKAHPTFKAVKRAFPGAAAPFKAKRSR